MALGLVLFLAVTAGVVWRRTIGVRVVKQIERLQEEKRSLLAQEKYLEGRLRRATSRRNVVQEAQRRLGMIRPTEVQTRFIAAPSVAAPRGADSMPADSALVP